MPKKYDVVAITGKYVKEGQEKNKYANVGLVIEKDGKFYLKMTHPVTIDDDGNVINFFSLYEPKPREPKSTNYQPKPQANDDFEDDVPFS